MCVCAGARWFQSASILGIFRPFQVDDTFNKHTVTWTQTPSQSKDGCLWDLLFGSRAGALLVGLVIFAVLQFLVGPIGLHLFLQSFSVNGWPSIALKSEICLCFPLGRRLQFLLGFLFHLLADNMAGPTRRVATGLQSVRSWIFTYAPAKVYTHIILLPPLFLSTCLYVRVDRLVCVCDMYIYTVHNTWYIYIYTVTALKYADF